MNTSKSLDELLYKYAEDLTDVEHIKLRKAIVEAVEGLIGEDEEVPSMEEYVEYRGGALNIEDDDNPEIEAEARNSLRAELRQAIKEWQ